jgi:hypothetical protein
MSKTLKDIRGPYRKLIDLERELVHKLQIVRQCMKDHANGVHNIIKQKSKIIK